MLEANCVVWTRLDVRFGSYRNACHDVINRLGCLMGSGYLPPAWLVDNFGAVSWIVAVKAFLSLVVIVCCVFPPLCTGGCVQVKE